MNQNTNKIVYEHFYKCLKDKQVKYYNYRTIYSQLMFLTSKQNLTNFETEVNHIHFVSALDYIRYKAKIQVVAKTCKEIKQEIKNLHKIVAFTKSRM